MSGLLKINFKGHFLLGKEPVISFSSSEESFFFKILILGGLLYSQLPKSMGRNVPLSPGEASGSL